MKNTALLAALALALVCAPTLASAQQQDIMRVWTAPYPFQPLCPGSHAVSLATATTLASAGMLPTGIASGRACVTQPVSPTYCVVTAKTAAVSYTLDGSTTASATTDQLAVGSTVSLVGAAQIAAAQFYSATGTLDVECSQ